MVRVCPELSHIKEDHLAIGFTKARSIKSTGLLASLTPLRFEEGKTVTSKKGYLYEIPELLVDGVPILYILHFLYPRFIDLPMSNKVHTIIHELWHISPHFNGDIRRFRGRTYAHSGRKSRFEEQVSSVVKAWFQKTNFDTSILALDSNGLKRSFGRVLGKRVSRPKLTRLP